MHSADPTIRFPQFSFSRGPIYRCMCVCYTVLEWNCPLCEHCSHRPECFHCSKSRLSLSRHEGRKMKQELRCHAVLCPNEAKARDMARRLQERLHQALADFRREKISRQNARLSVANAIYENPSMPYRYIYQRKLSCCFFVVISQSSVGYM